MGVESELRGIRAVREKEVKMMRFELCEICANRDRDEIDLKTGKLTKKCVRSGDCPGFVPGNLRREDE